MKESCPSGDTGWALYASGTRYQCKSGPNVNLNAVGGAAGLEEQGNGGVVANNDFNIDVKHLNLQYLQFGLWRDLDANIEIPSDGYNLDLPTGQRINTWFGTLD